MRSYWEPLERMLGASRCAGFMFMGRRDGVNFYKHGISRRYLLMDDSGRTFEARGERGFAQIPFAEALARVEQPLKDMGTSLETPYDDEYIAQKAEVLRAAGIEMVRIVIEHDQGEV